MLENQLLKQKCLHVCIIGALSVLVMSSSFYNGVTSGNDFQQHFQFAHTIYNSIISGEFYPSWAGGVNQGYGDAAIRFYPPFAYYILSASRFLCGNWYNAGLLTFFLIFWIGGTGVYFWAKEELTAKTALLAAALYVSAPYHVNQIYNNFLYAEFAAGAIIPFCFLFISRVCRRGTFGDALGLSVSLALLFLTHLPSSIIASVIFSVYAFALLKKSSFYISISKLAVSVAFSIAASSFYWIRMITELNWVKHSGEKYFSQTFDYRQNFLFAPQNILNFQNDSSVLWFADLMLMAVLLAAAPSAFFFFKNRKPQSRFSISIALIFAVSILFATPLSEIFWDNAALLQKMQFPWRWLGIISMSGAVFASGGIVYLSEFLNKNKNYLLLSVFGIILSFYAFMSAFVIKQAVYLPREEFNRQLENIETENSFDCWWTIWAKTEAFRVEEKLVIENRETVITNWQATEKEFIVSAGNATSVRVATFYYPYWQATVNNNPVQIEKADDSAILIPLPSESSHVHLYFQEPNFVRAANLISIGCWLVLLFALVVLSLKSRKLTD